MGEQVAVSVCCITYNHEKYVRKTLEGFVNQKTNFKFEVLVHDDASTDNTAEIIKEYAGKYPDIIKPIIQTENQYSTNPNVQETFNYPRVTGKYVAFCEGDDYWTDPMKLQKQYDAMENNPECMICVHKTRCIDKDGNMLDEIFPKIDIDEEIISAETYLHYELNESIWLFQTSSYFVRKEIIQAYLDGFVQQYPAGDITLVMLSLSKGLCFYIPEEMSCYRKDSGGVMSGLKVDIQKNISFLERKILGHKQFDELMNRKYHETFQNAILFSEIQICKLKGDYKSIRDTKYKDIRRKLSLKGRFIIWIGAYFPKLTFRLYQLYKKR